MNPFKKILISAFICFNFLAMVRVHLPMESRFVSTLYKGIDPYLSFFSIYQDWMMFSPNPSRSDVYITAKIEFEDGTTDTYDFEHGSTGLIEKYLFAERYRKISSEAISKNKNSFLWNDTARFALRKVRERNFNKLPVRVRLSRHWAETPGMYQKFQPHQKIKSNYSNFNFYTYEVM